jgi:two-component system phosphate regulon sensor histidine kinase PhoR
MGNDQASRGTGAGLLFRGEALIAAGGLAVVALMLTAVAVAAWWTMRVQERALLSREMRRVEQVASLLAAGLGPELSAGNWSDARRFVADAGVGAGLDVVRLELADGAVLASSAPSEIMRSAPPETWPALGQPAEPGFAAEAAMVGRSGPDRWAEATGVLTLAERGPVRLVVRGSGVSTAGSAAAIEIGFAAVGVVGLAALLLVYRVARRRLAVMLAVRDALLRCAGGAEDVAGLRMAPKHGAEADAWNAILEERVRAREQKLDEQLETASAAVGSRGNDLKPACDALPHGVLVLDAAMRIAYLNGAAAILLERRREDLDGAALADLELRADVVEMVRAVVSGESTTRSALEVDARGDGSTVVRFSARRAPGTEPPVTLVLIEDVTQQRVADRARSEFVAHVTHELRTPLTNIRLYVEEVVENGDDAGVRARCLNVLNQEARRLERIVGDMLSVAEIEAGSVKLQWGEIRLEPLLAELEADYQPQAQEKEIELRFDLPPKFPVMWGDRDKLLLALHNLVSNAFKYTPRGGSVTVRADADENQLRVEVADTGIGIAPEEHERVFERFYRAQDERVEQVTGTGIGLSLARELARIHGGDITVDSEMNKGSVFTLTAPTGRRAA